MGLALTKHLEIRVDASIPNSKGHFLLHIKYRDIIGSESDKCLEISCPPGVDRICVDPEWLIAAAQKIQQMKKL